MPGKPAAGTGALLVESQFGRVGLGGILADLAQLAAVARDVVSLRATVIDEAVRGYLLELCRLHAVFHVRHVYVVELEGQLLVCLVELALDHGLVVPDLLLDLLSVHESRRCERARHFSEYSCVLSLLDGDLRVLRLRQRRGVGGHRMAFFLC